MMVSSEKDITDLFDFNDAEDNSIIGQDDIVKSYYELISDSNWTIECGEEGGDSFFAICKFNPETGLTEWCAEREDLFSAMESCVELEILNRLK